MRAWLMSLAVGVGVLVVACVAYPAMEVWRALLVVSAVALVYRYSALRR